MDTLREYFELTDRVEKLRGEVELLEQIKLLEKEVSDLTRKLKNQIKLTSKHRTENRKLRDKYAIKKPSRCDKARELIAKRGSGELDITLKEIGEQVYLSYSTVKGLARDYRKQQKGTIHFFVKTALQHQEDHRISSFWRLYLLRRTP